MEARQLAECLAKRTDVTAVLSLAGRTSAPAPQAVPVRVGGFGGPRGLADYLRDHAIGILVDATHPYAAAISVNAATAAERTGIPLLVLRRAAWTPVDGDRWINACDTADAVRKLGDAPRRVFLALGRKEIAPCSQAPQHRYLVRSVEPITPPLAVPHATYITARGPFAAADERVLLEQHRIEVIVAKNSGGSASYGKIAAARALGLPVIMLQRPALPGVDAVETVEDALARLDHALTLATARGV